MDRNGKVGLGWGGGHRENVYAACSGCVGDLSLGDMDSCRDVPQYKVVKYLVFGIISSSLLLDCGKIPVYMQSYARAHAGSRNLGSRDY
jgi:hypothetical protein